MVVSPEQPRREVSSRVQHGQGKVAQMFTYLLDCYERVAGEERLAPKVSARHRLQNKHECHRAEKFSNNNAKCLEHFFV